MVFHFFLPYFSVPMIPGRRLIRRIALCVGGVVLIRVRRHVDALRRPIHGRPAAAFARLAHLGAVASHRQLVRRDRLLVGRGRSRNAFERSQTHRVCSFFACSDWLRDLGSDSEKSQPHFSSRT